jgi:hypothetical protein
MTNEPHKPIRPQVDTLFAAQAEAIDQLYRELEALLPPDDPKTPERRAELEKAFEHYRKCHHSMTVSVFLLMPNP